jgi:hypothetical protein
MKLPSCGIYRTRQSIGSVPAGKLVFFHNHGKPGPGVYLPERWKGNRMQPTKQGTPLPSDEDAENLEPLKPEGFYQVLRSFHCCEKKCRKFETDALVQLGYNREAKPILFTPEIIDGMLAIPERGTSIDEGNVTNIQFLKVRVSKSGTAH